MQKTELKASILIWAIFLSLIISVTFISISTKISKNLRENNNLTDKLRIDNLAKNIISNGSIDGNFQSQYLSNNEKIIFDSLTNRNLSLKQGETHLSKINTNSNVSIKILSGGPVTYKNNSSSGIISNVSIFPVSIGDDLIINNLGGYTKIALGSNVKTNFLSDTTNYKIIRKIGNKEIIKSKGTVKNF